MENDWKIPIGIGKFHAFEGSKKVVLYKHHAFYRSRPNEYGIEYPRNSEKISVLQFAKNAAGSIGSAGSACRVGHEI